MTALLSIYQLPTAQLIDCAILRVAMSHAPGFSGSRQRPTVRAATQCCPGRFPFPPLARRCASPGDLRDDLGRLHVPYNASIRLFHIAARSNSSPHRDDLSIAKQRAQFAPSIWLRHSTGRQSSRTIERLPRGSLTIYVQKNPPINFSFCALLERPIADDSTSLLVGHTHPPVCGLEDGSGGVDLGL